MKPIDQEYFDVYSKFISQCSKEILLEFIQMINEDGDHDKFPLEYYSHLMDTHIAFHAGVEYGRKNP
jgi:hypothetical protein